MEDWTEDQIFLFAQRAQRLAAMHFDKDPVRWLPRICKVLLTVPECASRLERCFVAEIVRRIAATFHVPPGTLQAAPIVGRLNRTGAGDVHVSRALEHAIQHFNDRDLTLESTARSCRLAGPYLSALVSERTGVRFTDQKRALRLLYAVHLLVTSPLSMKELADSCGYADTSIMDHEFDRWLDMTPGEFRRLAMPM